MRCPGPLGSCSPLCPLGALLCVCVVLATWLLFTGVPARCVACVCAVPGHWAPVHRCARSVCCFACAVSWATWLLFTGVPAQLVALRVRCPGPRGSCSPVCPLGVLFCLCGVPDHLAPVQRCARSVRCFACAVSWATWLLITGGPARCVACVCGVLGHLAPVHRCARLVRCFACSVSWATWLLFTRVPARCVVLRVRCPGPLGSCSPVCSLGVLCCVCGVLGHLALVHRCALPVCCAVSWATLLLFTGVRAPCVVLWVACAGRRCGAPTRPSGRWPFVAGRGWVPSRRALARPDGGCPRAVVRCVLCALSWFAAPGGSRCLAPVRVPWLWPAAASLACLVAPRGAPQLVRCGRSRCSGRLFDAVVPFAPPGACPPQALLGGCAGHAEAGREPGSLCLPLAPAKAGGLGSLCVVPVRGPAMGLSLAGPSGVGLGLRVLRWLACVDPVTDASGFSYRPSFDG